MSLQTYKIAFLHHKSLLAAQRSLVSHPNKASFHTKQALFAPQNQCLLCRNKPHFSINITVFMPKQGLFGLFSYAHFTSQQVHNIDYQHKTLCTPNFAISHAKITFRSHNSHSQRLETPIFGENRTSVQFFLSMFGHQPQPHIIAAYSQQLLNFSRHVPLIGFFYLILFKYLSTYHVLRQSCSKRYTQTTQFT